MSKSNGKTSSPRFDFSKIGRRWEKRFAHLSMEMVELVPLLDGKARDGLSAEEEFTLKKEMGTLAGRVRALDDERDALIVQVLADVPRDWLTDDAPEVIDWADVDALGWLKSGKYDEMVMALSEARSGKN